MIRGRFLNGDVAGLKKYKYNIFSVGYFIGIWFVAKERVWLFA